ncbi:hypothetical protein LJR219_000274 [Phenylobacterium sp. LjRoot219]|uniref:hypothetical protein n=1 Tax=Phenylobacterium sp. LjRoot219 TaxID=3342283 RepID=UPI003ED105AD
MPTKTPEPGARRRPTAVATVAGVAWLLAATLAQAQAAPPPSEPSGAAVGDAADAATAAPAGEVMAVPPVEPDRWRFTVAPYLWMASIKGSATFSPPIGSTSSINANIDESFGDILSDLNFALMAGAEARRGKFSIQTDLIYMNVEQKGDRVRDVAGPRGRVVPVNLDSKLKLKTTVWAVTGGYDVLRNDSSFIQLFAGFRYLGADSTLDWNFTGPLGDLARAGRVEKDGDVWDAIAGARGEFALGDGPWKVIYYGDIGGGGSEFTWQVSAQLAYAWSWGDVGLGWRYLDYDMDGDPLDSLTMSGPILGLRYRF